MLQTPLFRAVFLFTLTLLLVFAIDLSGTRISRLLIPILGLGAESGFIERLLLAFIIAIVVTANAWLLQRLSFKVQVGIIWVELLLLTFAFFYSFDLSFPYIHDRLHILIFTGAFTTLYISAISIVFAIIIALIAALARISQSGPAYAIATFYISCFRGTPLLLQIYLIYLGLPQLGVVLNAVPSGIIALSLCYGAYMAEIFRAGIQSIQHGQWEAATALGLNRTLTLRLVILPQAFRVIIPPIGNQFIAMLKDSSLVSVMGIWELMFLARTQGRAEFKYLEMLITAAVIYWVISFIFELIQTRIEKIYKKVEHSVNC